MALTRIKASNITDGTVVAAEIADDAIVADKIATNAVTDTKIAANAVTDVKISAVAASKLTGTVADARFPATLPAISGVNLTNLPAGGDKRNYIIDGDFTQWPEGTAARTIANAYGPALMYLQKDGDGAATIERSTSVPTFAQSGYSSKHSMLIKCTGTDASVAAGAYKECSFRMTGTDFNFLQGKEVTVSFWAKTAAANSGDTYCYQVNKTGTSWAYLHEFTATSTWTRFTHTFTMNSVATADDETGKVYFGFGLGSTGSNYQGTNNTWNSGWKVATSGMNNFFDSTSNELYISQHMVTLGSSAPSAFQGPATAAVKDQVDYYVQRFNFNSNSAEWFTNAVCSATVIMGFMPFRRGMRTNPSMTSTAASTFTGADLAVGAAGTSITLADASLRGVRVHLNTGGTLTVHSGAYITRTTTNTAWIMADARH